jgi:tetratricopeptide (TPR) repeat protein
MDRTDEAEPLLRQAEAVYRAALGDENRHVASCRFYLASLWQTRGNHEQAVELFRQALEMRRRVLPERHPVTRSTQAALAEELATTGDYSEAEHLLLDLLHPEGPEAAPAPDLASVHGQLADLYEAWGRPRQAAEHRAASLPEADDPSGG